MLPASTTPNQIKRRIEDYLETRNQTRTDFLNRCNIARGFFQAPGDPSGENLNKIFAAYPRLSADFLFRGALPMERTIVSQDCDQYEPSGVTTPSDAPIQVAEPTRPYTPVSATINVPASILDDLRDQLKKKDQQLENAAAQIATLQLQITELISKL